VDTAETPDQRAAAEKKVFGLFQHFDDIAVDPVARTLLLPVLANLAFDLKDNKAAQNYATQALELALRQGSHAADGIEVGTQAIHDANDVLGRVALQAGNVQQANEYLLKAATIPAEGTVSASGPRMLLAQALLDHGERDTVLQYLDRIRPSWKSGGTLLDQWTAAIRAGKPTRLNLVDKPISAYPR
jgi:hypothetical protein